jgi:hypothetical protein
MTNVIGVQCLQIVAGRCCNAPCLSKTVFHWKEYTEHTLDNGKPITELKNVSGSVNAFKEKFVKTLVKYKQHYFRYRWLNLCRKLDFTRLRKFDIYIQTDYSAQPVLDSQDKLSSVQSVMGCAYSRVGLFYIQPGECATSTKMA